MFEKNKWLWDVLGGSGLVLALLVVFLVNRTSGPAVVNDLEVVVASDPSANPNPKKLRLAVTGPEWMLKKGKKVPELWDNMGKLLNEMGKGYRYDELSTRQIQENPDILKKYDVLFLTCAPKTGPDLKTILFDYVSRGGMLYASDWRFDVVKAAFPDMAAPHYEGNGLQQSVEAEVLDPSLREVIGSPVELKFDLPGWKPAAFGGPRVKTLLRGKYKKQLFPGSPRWNWATAPLLLRFDMGQGTVIFTSFHNEKINSRTATKLLQYLVFRLVTADIDAKVNAEIREGGFKPQKSNLLSTPQEQSVKKTYDHDSGKPLRFALGFRSGEATLRFTITSPEGKQFQWEGKSTVILDVPDAPRGEWRYEVTAVDLPYPNFPFTVTVGEKE